MDTQTLLQEIARLSPDQFKVVRDFVLSQNDPAQSGADPIEKPHSDIMSLAGSLRPSKPFTSREDERQGAIRGWIREKHRPGINRAGV